MAYYDPATGKVTNYNSGFFTQLILKTFSDNFLLKILLLLFALILIFFIIKKFVKNNMILKIYSVIAIILFIIIIAIVNEAYIRY